MGAAGFLDGGTSESVSLKQILDGVVDAVVVADGVLAGVGIARAAIAGVEADAVSGGEGDALELETFSDAHVVEGLFGDGAATGLGGEIEDLLHLQVAESPDSREENGDGLADAGGGLDEQLSPRLQGLVAGGTEVFLTLSVGVERKLKVLDGAVALAAPLAVDPRPLQVSGDDALKEDRQLVDGERSPFLQDLPGLELGIGELDLDALQISLHREDVGVHLCLGPVQGVVGRIRVQGSVGGLDFLDQ